MQPCLDKVCGEDRGEFCGDCGGGDYYCSKDYQCVIKTEAPECKYFDCGDTTIQTFFGEKTFSCGTCNDNEYCSPEQKCIGAKWTFSPGGEILDAPSIGDDGTIYAVFIASNTTLLCATNPDGTEKWRTPIKPYRGPTIIGNDGTLYIGSENGLSARDPEDGAEKWNYSIPGYHHDLTAIKNDGAILAADDTTIYAINPDGALRWTYANQEIPDYIVKSPIVIGSNDSLYVLYYQEEGCYCYHVVAVNSDGSFKWTFNFDSNSDAYNIILGEDDVLFLGLANRVSALNSDGTEKWSLDWYNVPLVVDKNGVVYVGDYFSSEMAAIAPDGNFVWKGHYWFYSLLVDDFGTIYGIDNSIYALDGKGKSIWTIQGKFNQSVLTMGNDGTLYFYDRQTLYALPSPSTGPADSPWPMYRADAKRTGRVH